MCTLKCGHALSQRLVLGSKLVVPVEIGLSWHLIPDPWEDCEATLAHFLPPPTSGGAPVTVRGRVAASGRVGVQPCLVHGGPITTSMPHFLPGPVCQSAPAWVPHQPSKCWELSEERTGCLWQMWAFYSGTCSCRGYKNHSFVLVVGLVAFKILLHNKNLTLPLCLAFSQPHRWHTFALQSLQIKWKRRWKVCLGFTSLVLWSLRSRWVTRGAELSRLAWSKHFWRHQETRKSCSPPEARLSKRRHSVTTGKRKGAAAERCWSAAGERL